LETTDVWLLPYGKTQTQNPCCKENTLKKYCFGYNKWKKEKRWKRDKGREETHIGKNTDDVPQMDTLHKK